MSNEIKNLEPKVLWEPFYSLTQIPRPSNHEEQIQDFIEKFGNDLGLETIKDEVGNIIIRKPATPGMENRQGVIFQGHLDMVPQKNSDTKHDFEKDPIETLIDGEWVTANGTTLGADNGIGVAAAMAVLASKDMVHGPVEALFTATEETGMDGANGLKPGILQGDILLNLDSEDEGELYVGCAGGEDVTGQFTYELIDTPAGHVAYDLNITGLKGGHSGMDIILGRGNANKLFFRILKKAVNECGARLASINGGSLRNAIPREAFGVVIVPADNAKAFEALVAQCFEVAAKELAATEPSIKVEAVATELPAKVMCQQGQDRITNAVHACPNGVIRMSDSMKGLVETSCNMAIVKSNHETCTIEVCILMRSSVDSAKASLGSRIESLFTLAGATTTFSGEYPGWQPNMESPILKTMQEVYNNMYGKTPEIKAIHAGLECGILGGAYPNWDMISFGPTIRFPHSPDEKVNIATVTKFWDYIKETLKNIPTK